MKIYKIFVASSMKHSCRKYCETIVEEINKYSIDVKFDIFAYSETPVADHVTETQVVLNQKIIESDLFILLADNNVPIGEITMEEYNIAHTQSLNSPSKRPFIKVFGFLKSEDKKIEYPIGDGRYENFEDKLIKDSMRYVQFCTDEEFREEKFREWLKVVAHNGLSHNLTQKELSYGKFLYDIRQGGIRQNNEKYYRRDEIDGKIEEKLKKSPIVILEGNTYSGKTRAAFELMKNNKEWEDYYFHIYNNTDSIDTLNDIKLDFSNCGKGYIYFFDDINDIVKDGSNIFRRGELWGKLNGYKEDKGFTLEDFGKTRIIISVSGRLSSKERIKLYQNIFNAESPEFESNLKDIIVNFDIYDIESFKQMVYSMVRDGVLQTKNIRPGNYTIGSLFISKEFIFSKVSEEYTKNQALITTLVAHFKYASKSRLMGIYTELKKLYDYFVSKEIPAGDTQTTIALKEIFSAGIERLRSKGLIFISEENNRSHKVWIDKDILEVFTEVVIERIEYNEKINTNALNSLLIDYAEDCEKKRNSMISITKMGYWLIEHNTLKDNEIIDIVNLVSIRVTEKKTEKKTEEKIIIPSLTDNVPQKDFVTIFIKTLVNIINDDKEHYSRTFVKAVITNIQDFELAYELIEASYAYYKFCKKKNYNDIGNIALDLHKRAMYAILSSNITMAQEKSVISQILDDNGELKEPFEEDDLKEIYNLSHIIPFIKKKTALDIIDLLPKATLSDFDLNQFNNDDNEEERCYNSDNDDYDFSDDIDTKYLQLKDDGLHIYEKVFLVKLSDATINALCRVNRYEEFEEAIEKIRNKCEESIHIKRAIKNTFVEKFFRSVLKIAKRLCFDDRAKLFDFVLCIDDGKGVFGNMDITEDVHKIRNKRIKALNGILEYLDEKNAIDGYRKMIEKKLYDTYTLSLLMKNDFIKFEQLLQLLEENEDQKNILTLNQLIGKAETISDAQVCMDLMDKLNTEKINRDPWKLRDENALSKYLKIKGVSDCVEIIKERRNIYTKEKLSDNIVGIIINKLKIDQIIDIILPSEDKDDKYYKENYGLTYEEIENARRNAIIINKFFMRAQEKPDVVESVKNVFENIINNKELHALITDPDLNGNDAILSAYMKCKFIFSSYEDVRKFYDDLQKKLPELRTSNYIYSVFIWYIVKDYKTDNNRANAIHKMNEELINAYNEFADYYSKDKVVEMISTLYHYRLQLIDENAYYRREEFVYEDKKMNISYKEYLEYIKNHNALYVNGTFIYKALAMMQRTIDDEIFRLLEDIASICRKGVKYDTIYSKRKDINTNTLSEEINTNTLSEDMTKKLMKFDLENNELYINKKLIPDISYVKVLCYLQEKQGIPFGKIEEYRRKNKIPFTQTYINVAFKNMEQELKNNNDACSKMRKYIKDLGIDKNQLTIQMCIALIKVVPNEEELRIINEEFPDNLRKRVEVITANMYKILSLRNNDKIHNTLNEFKKIIIENCANINIYTINTYIYALMISKNIEKLRNCWEKLENDCKIDLFILLDLTDEEKGNVIKQLNLGETDTSWVFDADVRTFSYFADCSIQLISIMDEKFGGNFIYDKNGKKSCLNDAIKNYGYVYKKRDKYSEKEESYKEELEHIGKILSRKENYRILRELCNEYIIKSKQNKYTQEWICFDIFWKDMLDCKEFNSCVLKYICNLINEKYIKELDILNINDTERINILKEKLKLKDNEKQQMLENIDNITENIGNTKEVLKLIFDINIGSFK